MGIDFAGKTGSAQTISNDLKKRLGAEGKRDFKDNGWFVGVTPRRNPEIVVACLFEGGEHGALAARVAAKVIQAYVEKQRTRQTQVAKANQASGKQAEVAAVWHEGDPKSPDKMQAGRFAIPVGEKTKPVTAAPGVTEADKPVPAAALEATESHQEMAHPESNAPSPEPPASAEAQPQEQKQQKKPPPVDPTADPAATAAPQRQP